MFVNRWTTDYWRLTTVYWREWLSTMSRFVYWCNAFLRNKVWSVEVWNLSSWLLKIGALLNKLHPWPMTKPMTTKFLGWIYQEFTMIDTTRFALADKCETLSWIPLWTRTSSSDSLLSSAFKKEHKYKHHIYATLSVSNHYKLSLWRKANRCKWQGAVAP